eukprot:CAMPEP_0115327650 /NCGR_PEP_ID=MMETSP0270-20121206/84250_1 /TAXON_ID=71861 /ORGANISM="Scrippsiella trochoidea, Strain CCMP3099" /LENGTH=58 /DNA_ID=CAMNT_0002748099 /DNA_START=126 /DNA_END=299 /DNA_ORIENTATION=+
MTDTRTLAGWYRNVTTAFAAANTSQGINASQVALSTEVCCAARRNRTTYHGVRLKRPH